MISLILGLLFMVGSSYMFWKGRKELNKLISLWGNEENKHITKSEKEIFKNTNGMLVIGFIGILIGLFLLVDYFSV